jgi:diguanylate cyclase (GGDEF)-like protein/PAS domain S-box-containing protein
MASTGTSSFRIASAFRGGPVRWLILGGTLLIAAIAIGATVMAGNFRERALRSSERELENTVLLLAGHFDQQLEDFQVVQKDLIAFMRSSGIATVENYKRRMSGHDIHLMLKSKIDALSYVGGVNVFDAEGNLINASAAWPVPPVNSADRAFFRTFKSSAQSPEMLVEPVYSRVTGAWTTVIARKVTGPKGEFLGLIGRGIEPVNFEKFFATVALGPGASIAMFHSDGTLLARYPHVADMIGKNFKNGPAAQRQVFELAHSTSRLTSPMDGEDRLISSRTLTNFPIVIVASTATSVALADWREQIGILITVTGLSVLAIAALLFVVVRKLSHQHRASKQRLSLEKQRLDTAVNNMTQGLLLFDAKQHLIICNKRYLEMYGLSAEVVKPGCSFREVIAHRKDTGSFVGDIDHYVEVVMRDIAHRNAIVISTPDGRSIQIVNEPVPDGGWLATHEDITERRRAEERITHLAHYDALTDLPNRTLFHERLKRELSRVTPDRQLAVLYIDIDEFKSVNDSLGHMIGDELLKSVASSIAACARKTDFVARLGGDEFAIVQTGIEDTDDVMTLVSRIFDAIRSPYQCLGHQVTTDASIGIALAPRDGSDIDQILKNADLAMYAAKAAGRRTYRFFETDMEAEVRARRSLEMDLRQALVDGGFEV